MEEVDTDAVGNEGRIMVNYLIWRGGFMYKKLSGRKTFLFLILVAAFIGFSTMRVNAADGTYQYPLQPDTEEWTDYNHGELVELLDIPIEELSLMSTDDLVHTVLEYPLFGDMYFYDNYQKGFEIVSSHFNGLSDLLGREDAGTVLINHYSVLLNQKSDDNRYILSDLEAILAQPEIQEKLSDEEKDTLANLIVTKQKTRNTEYYFKSDTYQRCMEGQDSENIMPIANVTLKTPNGTNVYAMTRGEQITASDKAYMKNQVGQMYPSAVFLSEATTNYNCHSYAWYQQSTSNKYWINDPSPYWQDMSYKLLGSNNGNLLSNGIRVTYIGTTGSTDHSSIGNGTTQVVSKWGDYPLYSHLITYCPYFYLGCINNYYQRWN